MFGEAAVFERGHQETSRVWVEGVPMRRIALAVLVLIVAGSPVRAQDAGSAPLVLNLPASTRAMALGGAFMLSGAESDAIFYNPAALGQASGLQIGVQRYGSADLAALSGVSEWFDGHIGIGVQALAYGAGSGIVPDGDAAEVLFTNGPIGVAELAATLGYGREIAGVRMGAAGKVFQRRAGGDRATGLALDLGAARELGPVTVGAALRNLGPALETGGSETELPRRLTLGAAVPRQPVGPLDIGGAAMVARLWDGSIVGGGGIEVAWWPVVGRTFVGRIGVRTAEGAAQPFTFGAAFLGDALVLEYGYRSFEDVGGTHRITVGWR